MTITVTTAGNDDAPVADTDAYTVAEDGTLTVPAATGVLDNDTDPDGPATTLTAALVSRPHHGDADPQPGRLVHLHPRPGLRRHRHVHLHRQRRHQRQRPDHRDDHRHHGRNDDAPVADPDAYTVAEDGTLTVLAATGVLGNDTDPDDPATTLTAALVAGPTTAR